MASTNKVFGAPADPVMTIVSSSCKPSTMSTIRLSLRPEYLIQVFPSALTFSTENLSSALAIILFAFWTEYPKSVI